MTISIDQVCIAVELPRAELVTIVELGIVAPVGEAPDSWLFDNQMLATVRRARRLQRQLEIDWPGIALALQLLEQVEDLKRENQMLRLRLSRFLD